MPHISLSKKLASAKRSPSERKGIHSWHPYYAGYSEAFVTSAIEYLAINKSHLLLDPWHGSGTTALVASRYKLRTIGCRATAHIGSHPTRTHSVDDDILSFQRLRQHYRGTI